MIRRWLVLAVTIVAAEARAAGPTWVCSTADRPWAEQPPPAVVDPSSVGDVVVYPAVPGQPIDGFGGCVNELGWRALAALPDADRSAVLARLFGDGDGCRFTMARAPIGASDYAASYYSLDDTPGDLSLAHFSVERDKGCLIPYLRAAAAHRPGLRVWASPWTPPAWMKDNGRYAGGSLRQDRATLAAYAVYLARYIEAYRAAGVDVYAVHVQNEPRATNNYPTCLWTGPQERDFIRDHLGPTFRQRHVPAQIWLGTINDPDVDAYAGVVLADPAAAAFISGLGFQWVGQQAVAGAHRVWPRLPILQTENECRSGADSQADAEATFRLMCKYLRGGCGGYFYWNMVLPPGGRSSWGWQQNAMVTVDPAARAATYHGEFWAMAHVSHFARPGDRLAAATGCYGDDVQFVGRDAHIDVRPAALGDKVAFVRPDGSVVLAMSNSTDKPAAVVVGVATPVRRLWRAELPAHSFSTFVFEAPDVHPGLQAR